MNLETAVSAHILVEVLWQRLHDAACAPYRQAGRFAWHFARGKLGRDPVFRQMFDRRWIGESVGHRVLDIGCGQGLLASLLRSAATLESAGGWPPAWPSLCARPSYQGVELMPRDVARAQTALGGNDASMQFVCADMCKADFEPCDLVVILDVLHYVDIAAQNGVLKRVRDALRQGRSSGSSGVGGRLLLRVGDASQTRGFAISQWVDRTVTRIRGHRVSPTWGRPLSAWIEVLEALGFLIEAVPMSQGTPFANVLLVAELNQ